MFKGNKLSARNLTIVFSLFTFCAIGSGIASGQGGGESGDPPFYGWKLESISYHGEDVLNVWKRNQAHQIVPVTYTRDWAEGQWRENGQLIGNAEFVLPFSNEWATQMTISSSSEGYTVHRFKYYPAPGEETPQKASFVVNVNARAISSGQSEVENGFGDTGVGELPEWKSSHGKHLLERSVNSNGEVTVITPLRRAFASASGYQAQVGTIARYAWVHQDPRRARIHIANFRAEPDGSQVTYTYTSTYSGLSRNFTFPKKVPVQNVAIEQSDKFNFASYVIGLTAEQILEITRCEVYSSGNGWSTQVMRFPSQRSMFNFNLPAYATWENFVQERDQYSFSPGHTYMRFSEQLESWNYIDHFQSLMEGQVERFEGGYYVPGSGIYGVTRLLALLREDGDTNEMNVTLKYRWASDGTLAKSARQIRIVPSYQSIAVSSPFFDNEDPTRPQALSGWVDGSRHEVTISDVDPLYHFIGQATLSLIGLIPGGGTWAAVRAALGIGLSASATVGNATQAVFNRDPDRLYQGEGLAIGPANWRDYEMGGTGNWRDVLEHFNWRVYYVPEKLVKLEAFDLYGLSGFLGQTVVEHVEQRDKRVCQRQFRFWHSLAPEKPQN